MPLLLSNSNRSNLDIVAQGRTFPDLKELFQMLLTFFLSTLAWIFFRAADMEQALFILGRIFTLANSEYSLNISKTNLLLLFFFILMEWAGREQAYAIARTGFSWPKALRWAFYFLLIILIFAFSGSQQQFIYFQF
jgi:hypothetical protein